MISDPDVVAILYLVTIACFVVSLKFLASPRHARKGNWIGGLGMLFAIGTTLLLEGIENWILIIVALVLGSVVGLIGARNVRMTAMPQMVAIFNGVAEARRRWSRSPNGTTRRILCGKRPSRSFSPP